MKKRVAIHIFLILIFSFSVVQAKVANCVLVKQQEKMLLHQCAKLKVLTLKGNPVERAQLHGELLNTDLKRDAMNYFSERVFQEIENANFLVKGIFKWVYNRWVTNYHAHTEKQFVEEIEAMAKAANTDRQQIFRALALPDFSAFLVDFPQRGFLKTFVTLGCTSLAKKTEDKRFIYGRNLDFASTTIFDQSPLMTVQIPETGSQELRHITFGTDGLQFGGITGINEAGISFAVHQYLTKDASQFGVPMVLIGEKVLREARNLEQAAEIIKRNRPGPLWAFVIADLKQQQTWVVEVSSQNFNIRKMQNDSFAQTNHLMVSDKNLEIAHAGFLENSKFRYDKVLESLTSSKKFTASDAAKLLSFQSDEGGQLSASQDILKGETIQTVILDSYKDAIDLHLSVDPAPTASGRFASFSLNSLLQASAELKFDLNEFTKISPQKRANQIKLAQATHLQDLGKIEQAMNLFADQDTLDAKIFRAVSLYRLQKWQETITLTKELRKIIKSEQLAGQSVLWIELLALSKLNDQAAAKSLAKEILQLKVQDADFLRIATKIANARSLEDRDWALRYSLFSGYITNQAL